MREELWMIMRYQSGREKNKYKIEIQEEIEYCSY